MKKLIKKIFSDLFFIYRNIFHWNFSKILILISSYLMGLIFIIPIFILIFLIIYLSPLTLSNFLLGGYSIFAEFINNKFWFSIILILFIINLIIFFATINYKRVLFANLNLKYIEKKKLKFLKNKYFNFNLLFKNIKIHFIIISIILLLSLIFIFIFLILIYIYGGITNINNLLAVNGFTGFSIFSLIIFILYLLVLLYLLYRTYFSFYILLENEEKTAIWCIKKSIKKTNKNIKIFKLLGILFLFFVILLPVNYIGQYIDFNKNNLEYYINLKNKKISKQKFSGKESIDYPILETKYSKYKNEELVEKYYNLDIIKMIYLVFYFIFIFGIFDLIFVEFYKKEIK